MAQAFETLQQDTAIEIEKVGVIFGQRHRRSRHRGRVHSHRLGAEPHLQQALICWGRASPRCTPRRRRG
jgi:hypothetical protein